jgi:hypothetical protein
MRRLLIPMAAALVLVAAAGCGGGGPSGDVSDTVKGFASAVRDGDYRAVCERYLSNEIRQKLTDQGGCQDRVKTVVGAAGARAFQLEVVSVKVRGTRARARVRTTQGGRSATASLALLKEDGEWHVAGLP